MKHNLIKTDNYLLVVDDSEIKEGDWIKWDNKVGRAIDTTYLPSTKKIISHTPLNGAPYLDGVDRLPPIDNGDDVEILVPFPGGNEYRDGKEIGVWMEGWIEGHEEGYNKAREKYKFTEEDMMEAMEIYSDWVQDVDSDTFYKTYKLKLRQVIQSLQQPKYPIAFECEVEAIWVSNLDRNAPTKDDLIEVPKTIVNSEGRTEWVGKYIYE